MRKTEDDKQVFCLVGGEKIMLLTELWSKGK